MYVVHTIVLIALYISCMIDLFISSLGGGYFHKTTEKHSIQDRAHVRKCVHCYKLLSLCMLFLIYCYILQVYSVVTDKELITCSYHISGDADLSILAKHLGIPPENTTNPPRDALAILKQWKQQHKSRAYKQTLDEKLNTSGNGFEKASRAYVLACYMVIYVYMAIIFHC